MRWFKNCLNQKSQKMAADGQGDKNQAKFDMEEKIPAGE